jgi:Protein tyrosine and serine/threonine kinase
VENKSDCVGVLCSEPHLLIMEYVMYGKLLTFLRDHRTRRDILHFSSSDDDGGEQALNSWDLTHFAYCIAKGMEYLVSRGVSDSQFSSQYHSI